MTLMNVEGLLHQAQESFSTENAVVTSVDARPIRPKI